MLVVASTVVAVAEAGVRFPVVNAEAGNRFAGELAAVEVVAAWLEAYCPVELGPAVGRLAVLGLDCDNPGEDSNPSKTSAHATPRPAVTIGLSGNLKETEPPAFSSNLFVGWY